MNKRTPVCLVLKSAVLLVTLLCVFPLFATNPQKKEMKELNVKKVSLANVAERIFLLCWIKKRWLFSRSIR